MRYYKYCGVGSYSYIYTSLDRSNFLLFLICEFILKYITAVYLYTWYSSYTRRFLFES